MVRKNGSKCSIGNNEKNVSVKRKKGRSFFHKLKTEKTFKELLDMVQENALRIVMFLIAMTGLLRFLLSELGCN